MGLLLRWAPDEFEPEHALFKSLPLEVATIVDESMNSEANCEVTGKRKYLSEREALETAAHQLTQPNPPKELRAYFCTWCETWHLTKNAPRNK